MERDFNRYMVIKMSHAEHALTKEERDLLWKLGVKVAKWRRAEKRTPFECLVIEHDWPEYEPAWQSIEARADKPMSLNLIHEHEYERGHTDAVNSIRHGYEPFLIKGISPFCQGWNDYMRPLMEAL